jgi:3-oxoacyl-[acyl-carrier protein] reductase
LSDQKPFGGRVAIVTGGTRGIGRAIAVELARRGADVAFNYAKNAEAAETLKSELESLGVRALAVQCDVANTEAAAEMVKQVKDAFGRIDFLVNNAGITRDNLILRMKEEDWDEVVNTNLKGAWNFAKAVLRTMLRQDGGGSILKNGGVMFLYSLILLYMNNKILSRSLSMSPLRFVAIVWSCAFFGYFTIQALQLEVWPYLSGR